MQRPRAAPPRPHPRAVNLTAVTILVIQGRGLSEEPWRESLGDEGSGSSGDAGRGGRCRGAARLSCHPVLMRSVGPDLEGQGWQGVTGSARRRDHLAEEVACWDLREVRPTNVEMVESGV